MKIKKVTFEHTGEFRKPEMKEWICGDNGIYVEATGNRLYEEYEICTRTETIEDWKPENGDKYYVPKISHEGLPTSSLGYNFYDCTNDIKDFTFIFPTYELAMQQAKRWVETYKKNNSE